MQKEHIMHVFLY